MLEGVEAQNGNGLPLAVRLKNRESRLSYHVCQCTRFSLLNIGSVTSVYWNAVYLACHPPRLPQKQARIFTSTHCVSSPA